MVFLVTAVPTQTVGRKIASYLLKQKSAACISITSAIESHYVWKGKCEKSREFLCWIKTRKSLARQVECSVKAVHPYEVPEIVIIPVTRAFKPYLDWIYSATK